MIIHFTAKLRKKLHIDEVSQVVGETGPHLRWYAHLFRAERAQYILTTNAASLYSIVLHGGGVTDDDLYLRDFISNLRDYLAFDDMRLIYERCIAPRTGDIRIASCTDKSVLGSMNDMVRLCKLRVKKKDLSPWEMADALNATPFKAIAFRTPRKAFLDLPVA